MQNWGYWESGKVTAWPVVNDKPTVFGVIFVHECSRGSIVPEVRIPSFHITLIYGDD